MVYVIYTLYVIACVILIAVVLLQPGKGDVASALGGGTSGAAFGPRGATTLLAKVTVGAAITFMTLAFLFSVPGVLTPRSVTSGIETGPAPAPADATVPVPDAIPAEQPTTATPAGTIEVKPDGTMKTEAPAPAGAAPAETKTPADAKPATPPTKK